MLYYDFLKSSFFNPSVLAVKNLYASKRMKRLIFLIEHRSVLKIRQFQTSLQHKCVSSTQMLQFHPNAENLSAVSKFIPSDLKCGTEVFA